MTRRTEFVACVGLLSLLSAGAAFAGESPSAPAPTYTEMQKLPGAVTLATLSNGLTVIVQENHTAPVATVRCYVKNTGSAYEGRYLGAGLSHVLEHVVAGGTTTKRPEKEIRNIIDGFGGASNAATSTERTVYFIDCPAANVDTAVELVADMMQRVAFEPSEFAREMKVVTRELSDGEVNRGRVLWTMLSQTLYEESPARHPVIGYLEVLEGVKKEAIIDFYRDRYVPNNQVFVVVGDVDTKHVMDQIARDYAGTPRGRETDVVLREEPDQVSPREAIREMDGATYDLAYAWPTVKLSHPDLYALDVAAYILGEGESSRLARRLKHERPLVQSVNAVSGTPHYVRGFFGIFTSAPPDTWKDAEAAIREEVERLRTELVAPAELAKAKKQKAAELILDRQTVKNQAESLATSYLSTGDPLFDQAYVAGIERVTAEEIRDVAQKYLVPERFNRVVIAPPGGALQRAEARTEAAETGVRLKRLSNGLRVLVKRNSQLPLVNMQAVVLAGGLVDTEATAGRCQLLADMLDRGTEKHTAQEIAEYFDSVGGRLEFSAGRFTIMGNVTALKDDFPQAASLMAECLTQPAFRVDEFAKVQRLMLAAIAARANSPQAETMDVLYDNLPTTSPFHINSGGKVETVSLASAQDLGDCYRKYFVPNNMVVTIFGDIEPDKALALAENLFGGMKPNPELPAFDFDRSNKIEKSTVHHKQTAKDTGMVVMGYTGPSVRDEADFAALTLLDTITSGYGYPGGWLHEELRGEGLVYWVHALPFSGPTPGFFVVMAQTDPKAIDEVVRRIGENLQRARQGKITEDEFRTAVSLVKALHAQENTTMAEQAREAAINELYGLGHDYGKRFDERIDAVKREDVARVANKYLNEHVVVTSSPEAK